MEMTKKKLFKTTTKKEKEGKLSAMNYSSGTKNKLWWQVPRLVFKNSGLAMLVACTLRAPKALHDVAEFGIFRTRKICISSLDCQR